MAETSLQLTITEEKLSALKYLKRFHPVSLRCGFGLPIPGDLIGIDHDRPVSRISNIYRPLIYPHHIFDYCKKLWQDDRPIRFGFTGLAHTTRDLTLRTWYHRFGSQIPSIHPEHWGNEMAPNQLFQTPVPGKCAIIYSDRGRNFPVKVWDDDYYRCLSQTEFALCPNGEKIWSYRFFEAIICGAIPVVETTCSSYDGFIYYKMDDASTELQYNREVAESNFTICRTKLTVPLDALDATLTAAVAELGRGARQHKPKGLWGDRGRILTVAGRSRKSHPSRMSSWLIG